MSMCEYPIIIVILTTVLKKNVGDLGASQIFQDVTVWGNLPLQLRIPP
jgi:hypothetical protein